MLLMLALAVMTVAVVAMVIAPLLKGARPAPGRAAFDRAVYRDQLKELERDVARGLVDKTQAATARLEIERRLLAADAVAAPPARAAGSPRVAAMLAIALPVAAVSVYLALGAPGVPDRPYAARGPERARAASNGNQDLDKTAADLEARLTAEPDRADDWLLLGRTRAALGQWQKSVDAYRRALALTGDRPDLAAAYGESLVMAAEGIVTPTAREAFAAVLAKDPGNAPARYYLALAEAQAGNAQAAIDRWQELAAEAPETSPLRAELGSRIADAAKAAGLPVPELAPPSAAAGRAAAGPGAEDLAAAAQMPPEQRMAMIRNMVEGLAAKLQAKPDDLDGWLRLGRAYTVLLERDKAVDAYEHAGALKPDDPAILLDEAEALLAGHKPEDPLPPRAVGLLHRVEALDPRQPAALWYLGLAEAQGRRPDAAARYWRRLLALLPPESQEHKMVDEAIAAVNGK